MLSRAVWSTREHVKWRDFIDRFSSIFACCFIPRGIRGEVTGGFYQPWVVALFLKQSLHIRWSLVGQRVEINHWIIVDHLSSSIVRSHRHLDSLFSTTYGTFYEKNTKVCNWNLWFPQVIVNINSCPIRVRTNRLLVRGFSAQSSFSRSIAKRAWTCSTTLFPRDLSFHKRKNMGNGQFFYPKWASFLSSPLPF